ncbi:LysR family transcriptional regulator [Pseudomonas syringae pv. actinidiae]|uniref:LysR family transcriptional regulator n=1 Tax=Pseudomonas syringae TaxID=317 RepID=UPI000BB531BF|nr:LysR family transcriptional regulator [Pseudomonas syringae]PBK47548.1 LysR family transcriptional regulator [Pseudomonas syringae pv. actinidiae]PBK47604.1 LysR family transcriptional regulator [Pseudomonas syringae pv. actinidiae]RJX50246.1 LysR family transcriptional regulator [Pseudomonas syringae pv. actinidiae]RJX50279.1 LysR family transcriptional regulator [Pseudomonas syringae pv. actinidiae]RJX53529.1 LysR family transcriptional regulator [Pseudomonas syringae pv. actinidiae]
MALISLDRPASCGFNDRHSPKTTFDWEDLRYFLTFATVKSLSGAAKKSGVEHATVSRRIASLEKSLNVKLVDRRKRLYELTDDGRKLAVIGRRIEEQAEAIGRLAVAAQDAPATEVTISAPSSVAIEKLVPQLGAFRAMHPGIVLRLLGDHQYSSLSSCQSDLCIRFSRPVENGIVARRIGTASFSFYCSSFYLEQRLGVHYEFIGYDSEVMTASQNAELKAIVGTRPFVLEAKTVELQIRAAEASVGIALLPDFAVEQNPRLCRLELSRPLEVGVWLGVHEDLRSVASIQAAMNYVESCYR